MVIAMVKALETPLKWTPEQVLAVFLIFEGRLSQAKVAEKVGVSTRTIEAWCAHPDFQQRLAGLRENLEASLTGVVYADKCRRVIALDQMAEAARHEFEERPWLKEVRPTPNGPITNESFNEGAFAAFRGALDDIAKELGHRRPKEEDNKPQMRVVFIVPEVAELPKLAAPVIDSDTWPDAEDESDGDSST